jgi:hypothetical protein
LQGDTIEKTQGGDGLVEVAPGNPLVLRVCSLPRSSGERPKCWAKRATAET